MTQKMEMGRQYAYPLEIWFDQPPICDNEGFAKARLSPGVRNSFRYIRSDEAERLARAAVQMELDALQKEKMSSYTIDESDNGLDALAYTKYLKGRFGCSSRVKWAIHRARIKTDEELIASFPHKFDGLRGVGKTTLWEIAVLVDRVKSEVKRRMQVEFDSSSIVVGFWDDPT